VHPHSLTSTDSFVAMPPQPIPHPQYSNIVQSNPGVSSLQTSGHPGAHSSDLMMGRNNMVSGHPVNSTQVHSGIPTSLDNFSNINGPVGNQYGHSSGRNVLPNQSLHHLTHQSSLPPAHSAGSNYPLQNHSGHYNPQPPAVPPHNAFPGRSMIARNWHSTDHSQLRESVAEEIVKILKSRKPNANDNWHDKLPHMARRLEDALYYEASTLEEYADRSTLKHRLQQLALSMGNNKGNQPKPTSIPTVPSGQPHPNSSLQANSRGSTQQSMNYGGQSLPFSHNTHGQNHLQHFQQHPQSASNPAYLNYPPQQSVQRPPPNLPQQYSQLNVNSGTISHQVGTGVSMSQNLYHSNALDYQQQLGSRNPGVIPQTHTYSDSQNDNFARSYQASMVSNSHQQQSVPAVQNLSAYGKTMDDMNPHYSSHPVNRGNLQSTNSVPAQMNSGPMNTHNMLVHSSVSQNTDEHRKQVLKQQQQRLLLLRHASKCPHENGRCPVTPHCWNMKQLWKHIMSCKDQDCKMAHCVSSRYVLSHYSKCKEPTCPVCGPVREAIKRNYERSRDVVKMARNPNPHITSGPGAVSGNVGMNSMMTISNQKVEEPEKKKLRKKNDTLLVNVSMQPLQNLTQPAALRPPPRKIYPLDPISSAIYSFTNEQIQSHFRTIHEGLRLTVMKIKEICKPLIDELFRIPHAQGVFGLPVDPLALGLADYFDIVKFPMDLGTVLKKLEGGSYRDLQNFCSDVQLTFDNAMLYNPKNTDVFLLASTLKKEFDKRYKSKVFEFDRTIEENRKNKDACLVCGEVALKYEPPVYYCNGTCAQRIRRNAVFYSNSANTYHWCSLCFNSLKENEVLRLPDCTITKSELALNKKKHIEESHEGWVECEGGCKRWVHQICSLFNNRRNVSDDVSYVCPLCLQEKRRRAPTEEIVATSNKKMKASDLPVTTLSEFLEKRIYKRLELAYEESAQKLNVDVSSVEKCPPLTLRQVSCVDKLQQVRDGFYNRYKEKGYPTDFPCRSKCLVLFQNIDGQDVILFGMYVYEYGHKCPLPNQRRVYISYLDSVHYLRPKQYRTMVYHEILISYLDYVRSRGFHTCHIWACPPQKGDDYILYVHPVDQKTPKPQILRIWYDEMLKRCVERGIVCEVTDLHSEYLADPSVEAVSLPYFEGDYWVNEAEVIIKNFDDRKEDDYYNDGSGNKSKRRNKSKRPGKTSLNSSSTGKTERDPLMSKLASIIEPMKDTFFVARLHPKEYVDRVRQVDTVLEAAKTEESKEKTDKELQEEALSGQDIVPDVAASVSSKGTKRPRDDDDSSQSNHQEDGDSDDDFMRDASMITANSDKIVENESKAEDSDVVIDTHVTGNDTNIHPPTSSSSSSDSGTVESLSSAPPMTVKSDVVPSTSCAVSLKGLIPVGEDMPDLPDDTEDVDDIQESEHFDTRQSFLNLCQGNHYQYDQLRRAKHSSMMVLYHLHNPDAPKFVPSCANCHVDILTGVRHRCEKCEVDYCQSCVVRLGSSIHNHPLRPVNGNNSAPSKLTEEQRRERQRSIQLHMQLLNHAANCTKCDSRNCAKMKVGMSFCFRPCL
jgi:hypothetical protein